MTPAHILLNKLDQNRRTHIVRKDRISADQAIEDFAAHLDWLASRHIKKSWSDQYLIDGSFGKSRIFQSDAEVSAFCRVNLVVAKTCFDQLITDIKSSNKKVRFKDASRYKEQIRDYIFDLKPIAEFLEQRKNPNYVFLDGGKNYGVHTWEVFRLSRQLAIQSAFRKTPFHFDHKTSQIASVFVLRQALEAKYERLVGVAIHNKYGETPKLRHGFHYDFILTNPEYFDFKSVNFEHLKKIYEWCNEIVHKVFHPYAWQIAYAHTICRGLFYSLKVNKGAAWSINNAVVINNLSKMQNQFIDNFIDHYDHGIWSIEKLKPEAVVI